MTKEKLNELKEAIEKAGECGLVTMYIDGHMVTNLFTSEGMEFVADEKPYMNFNSGSSVPNTLVWFEDHPDFSYSFQCRPSRDHVNYVTYCNGEITTINR